MEKFMPDKVWTAVLYDAEQNGYLYLKRFMFEDTSKKQNCMGENKDSRLVALTDEPFARFKVVFGGDDAFREPLVVDAADYVGVKSYKAKGKRVTVLAVNEVTELEPIRHEESEIEPESEETSDGQQQYEGNELQLDYGDED